MVDTNILVDTTFWWVLHYALFSGGWLLPLAFMLRVTVACPESCLVCTQDVTLCQQLTYIVGNKLIALHSSEWCSQQTSCYACTCTTLYWLLWGHPERGTLQRSRPYITRGLVHLLYFLSLVVATNKTLVHSRSTEIFYDKRLFVPHKATYLKAKRRI